MIIFLVCMLILRAEAILNLTEGSECVIHKHKGKCVGAKSCPSFNLVDLNTRGLNESEICSFNNIEAVICCLDCEPYTRDYRDSTITGDGYLWKNGKKAWDKCVEYLGRDEYSCKRLRKLDHRKIYDKEKKCFYTDRISTGSSYLYSLLNTRHNWIAHIAMLEYGEEPKETQWLCAGSLISERFVLTAAQCGSNPELGPVTYVSMGLDKRDDTLEKRDRYIVKTFISHPEYKPTTSYHNIALIETMNDVVFTDFVIPVCLVHGPTMDEEANLIGWASDDLRSDLSDVNRNYLRQLSVQKLHPVRCSVRYSAELPQGVNSTLQACFMNKIDDKSCEGLPGLPLEVKGRFVNQHIISCASFLVAVTAFNRTCDGQDGIGLYTRVQSYIPWIESIAWPEV